MMQLKIGTVYQIRHRRKGNFVALLIAIVDGLPGDQKDTVFWTMRYDVRHGTDQARLATQPKQRFRESNIRPSLVLQIEEYAGEHWLREVAPPPAPVIEDEQSKSLLGRLFKR